MPPPLVFGRPETAGAPGTPERGEPAQPESSRPEPVRGGAPRGDMLRGDMPPAGSRVISTAPDSTPRTRVSAGRTGPARRGRGEPGAAPLPSPAAHGDAGEAEAAARQDLYGAPVAMPFLGAPERQPVPDDLSGRGDAGGRGRSLPPGDQEAHGSQPPSGPGGPAGPAGPAGRGRPASGDYPGRIRGTEEPSGYGPGGQEPFRGETLDQHRGGVSAPGPFRRSGGAPPGPAGPGPQSPLARPDAHGAPGAQGAHASPVTQGPQSPQAAGPVRAGPARRTGPAALRPAAERPLQRAPADQCARTAAGSGLADRRGAVGA